MVVVRPIGADEFGAFCRVDERAFAYDSATLRSDSWSRTDLHRCVAAFDGAGMVGIGRTYSLELTLPGLRVVPAAGVSWIATLPTHRRRGVQRSVMQALHADARDRGESVAILTASEGGIYGRLGYGVATWRVGYVIDTRHAGFAAEAPDAGRVRFVEDDEARRVIPPVWDAARLRRVGGVSRSATWWPQQFWEIPVADGSVRHVVVHEDTTGAVDGYADYEIDSTWELGVPARVLTLRDLQGLTTEAEAALWRHVLGVDLVRIVRADRRSDHEALRWWLADVRALRTEFRNDELWVRLLDVPGALAARHYGTEGRLVLAVEETDGTVASYRLEGGPGGASCVPTTDAADVHLGVAALGALYLGGNSWAALAAAGQVRAAGPDALRRADLMFAVAPAPAMLSWF